MQVLLSLETNSSRNNLQIVKSPMVSRILLILAIRRSYRVGEGCVEAAFRVGT